MKVYKVERRAEKGGPVGVIATVNGQPLIHIVHHSPTGFEFGYGGSGPADLALSILANYFGEEPSEKALYHGRCKCWKPHQDFKWRFIAPQQGNSFEITEDTISSWIVETKQELVETVVCDGCGEVMLTDEVEKITNAHGTATMCFECCEELAVK